MDCTKDQQQSGERGCACALGALRSTPSKQAGMGRDRDKVSSRESEGERTGVAPQMGQRFGGGGGGKGFQTEPQPRGRCAREDDPDRLEGMSHLLPLLTSSSQAHEAKKPGFSQGITQYCGTDEESYTGQADARELLETPRSTLGEGSDGVCTGPT